MLSSWVVLCVVIGAIPVAVRPGLGPFPRYGSGAGVVAFVWEHKNGIRASADP